MRALCAALRRRSATLALDLLGCWRRGQPLVRSLRSPGLVVDLGTGLLARVLGVLGREGPISEPRLFPPPPNAGPAPGTEERRVASGRRTRVWMASIKVPSSMVTGEKRG